ncbi:TraB/GumN family protein [Telluribacter sp. SYSU D00476]|uniref:TraB/GumN family protein n=1 Tax=Telluribacter sp. SYSU D00476 TaxID=2811430 RepID=UPI001FF37679|nr:TraB/GumN family protein [Telluribacter sp. SYSU D00476]
MRNIIKKRWCWLLIGLSIAATSARAQAPQEPSLLWEISGKGLTKPSYLYGTIHLICPGDFILEEVLKERLQKAEQLTLELDMDDPGMMMSMAQLMLMKDNKQLSTLLPQEDYLRLNQFFRDSVGMNITPFERAKPFVLMSLLFNRVLNCQPQSYEMTLVGLAKKQQIEVVGLETVAEQMAVFDTIPYQDQARMLVQMIDNLPKARTEFTQMVNLYKKQDVAGLHKMTLESDFDMQGQEETLLYGRNRRWIPLMANMMGQKSTFFAVGAAHLGGTEGVIALLRKQGYKVVPVRQ